MSKEDIKLIRKIETLEWMRADASNLKEELSKMLKQEYRIFTKLQDKKKEGKNEKEYIPET